MSGGLSFKTLRQRATPTITNKTDRTVDPGTPTGWKKFNSGDADLQIDNVLKPFRWEAASQKVNGRWSDWKIILLSVGGERVQAWFTFVARHKFVQWRRWKSYQITNNVESVTDYTDADVPSSVTGTEARAKALDALRWVDGIDGSTKQNSSCSWQAVWKCKQYHCSPEGYQRGERGYDSL